jgi:hypothetical protein
MELSLLTRQRWGLVYCGWCGILVANPTVQLYAEVTRYEFRNNKAPSSVAPRD